MLPSQRQAKKAGLEEMALGQTTKPHLWDMLSQNLLDPAIVDNIIHGLATIYKGFQQTKNMKASFFLFFVFFV